MKKINKADFHFLDNDGLKIEPVESQLYYNYEIRFCWKFPFIKKCFVEYIFDGCCWNETGKKF